MALETHDRVEKITAIMFFVFVNVTPVVLLPPFIYSYFKYFATDLGRDAFLPILPMWWAWAD